MDAQLIYNPRTDVLRAGFGADVRDATAVPLRDFVILLSDSGEVLAIDVVDFTGFVRKYVRPNTESCGEALFAAVRGELATLLAPWFANIGPLAAEAIAKSDAPFSRD